MYSSTYVDVFNSITQPDKQQQEIHEIHCKLNVQVYVHYCYRNANSTMRGSKSYLQVVFTENMKTVQAIQPVGKAETQSLHVQWT